MKEMKSAGLNPLKKEDRLKNAKRALEKYYSRTTEAVKCINPDMPVFHNSGNIPLGRRDIFKWFSHQELESLPTGGWGYDHFPLTAKYASGLGQEYLGMTGKFHTTWGEFGGFKTADALRYECAAMIAFGAKCSIGDQLHPSGLMDSSTYKIIGKAYKEVAEKEPWCRNVKNVADIGLLSCVANKERLSDTWNPENRDHAADIGATRLLLEGHFLFDVLDDESNFDSYKAIILPDEIRIDSFLHKKIDSYLSSGGKVLFSGDSVLSENNHPLFNIGATVGETSPYSPDFILPSKRFRPDDMDTPIVMYAKSRRLTIDDGQSLGNIYDPYFNRSYDHFCSHQHAPYKPESSEYSCGVLKNNILYLPHKIFSLYRCYGAAVYKQFFEKAFNELMKDDNQVNTNLPSTARLVVNRQEHESRTIVHLLYGNTVTRGGGMSLVGGVGGDGTPPLSIEIIDTLLPLSDIKLSLKIKKPSKVLLEPQNIEPDFYEWNEGVLSIKLNHFTCHQMIVLED
jgi:hypothetical protein